jgi:hypothetical protein
MSCCDKQPWHIHRQDLAPILLCLANFGPSGLQLSVALEG